MKDQSYYFLLVKMIECLDTIVMSMRGGLYYRWVFDHHFAMIIFAWIAIAFVPAGTSKDWKLQYYNIDTKSDYHNL